MRHRHWPVFSRSVNPLSGQLCPLDDRRHNLTFARRPPLTISSLMVPTNDTKAGREPGSIGSLSGAPPICPCCQSFSPIDDLIVGEHSTEHHLPAVAGVATEPERFSSGDRGQAASAPTASGPARFEVAVHCTLGAKSLESARLRCLMAMANRDSISVSFSRWGSRPRSTSRECSAW